MNPTMNTFQTQFSKITEEGLTSLMFQYIINDPFYSPMFDGMVRVTDTEGLVVGDGFRIPRLDLTDELILTLFNEWRDYNGI